jgi:hypothetical protein
MFSTPDRSTSSRRPLLGHPLSGMLHESGLGVTVERIERIAVDPDWFRGF